MQYALNGTDYSTTIPTGINAGEYTVWYKVVGDNNHNDTAAASVKVTIGKATIALSGLAWDYTGPFTYADNTARTVTVTGVPSNVNVTYTDNSKTDAGTYTAKAAFSAKDSANYQVSGSIDDLNWVINKASLTVTANDLTVTYSGSLPADTLISGTAKLGDRIIAGSWQWVTAPTSLNVGTHTDGTVKFIPNAADAKNVYASDSVAIKLIVTTAAPGFNGDVETENEDGVIVVLYGSDADTLADTLPAGTFLGADGKPLEGTIEWSDKDGNFLPETTPLSDLDDGAAFWTFTSADGNYTISGAIAEEDDKAPWWAILGALSGASDPIANYKDLNPQAWYAEAVRFCIREGLMNGVSENEFNPNGGMTRAMVWTVLGRISGQKFDGTGTNWYAEAQAWAMNSGVSDGTNPNGQITREELVTMLWRFAGSPAADTSVLQWYDDAANVSDWAKEAMAWAVNSGLIEGSNWNLMPTGTALRCQVAAIFMRYSKYF